MKDFYALALPDNGSYCVAEIDPTTKRPKHTFVESIDELVSVVQSKKDTNVFVALSNFKGHSRKADNAISLRSFFVDLDVGQEKEYNSKEEAIASLDNFVSNNELPPPVVVDSGTGAHAYWFFNENIPVAEWKIYATKFKDFCLNNGLKIDPVVTADVARILRCPDTFNHKTNIPTPTKVIRWSDFTSDFTVWKDFLGEVEIPLEDIVKREKITDLGRQMAGHNNYSSEFAKIATKSLDEDSNEGCLQMRYIINNRTALPEPLWYAGLSIAQHCIDRDEAIHLLSQDYEGYNKEATENKANQTQDKPQSCATFNTINPGVCDGCIHFNKITNPLSLGKTFVASPTTDKPIHNEIVPVAGGVPMVTTKLHGLPPEINGFKRGVNGGIVYKPAPTYDANGELVEEKEHTVTTYDLYPTKRIYSTTQGDCMMMVTEMPNDKSREFMLPFSSLYDGNELRKVLSMNGVLFDPLSNQWKYIMSYVVKWGQYLIAQSSAEVMRNQMGWTEDYEAFVVGNIEINREGKESNSPTSPLCRGIAKHLIKTGEYDTWKLSANKLNAGGLEVHAFVMLTGFSSILMPYTSTSGVTMCLTGETGAAKTASLYACLSVWGNPKDLSVLDATENGMTGRYLALHNIPFGLDEVGNIHGKTLSQLIHKVSQGKAKIRMQASVNAEREHELSAALVAIFTSNHSLYDKLAILKKDPNGEVARLIEIYMRKAKILADDPSEGRAIFDPFRTNYGWAGPEFVKELMKYSRPEIEAKIAVWVDKFKKDFGDDTAFRFYENLVAVTMVSSELAAKADIVHLDTQRIYKKIVSEMIDIRDNVVKTNSVNYQSLIGEFLHLNNSNTLIINGGHVTTEPRNTLVVRLDLDKKELCLSKPAFRKFLTEENNVTPKQWLFQMAQTGVKIVEKKKKMASNWKPGIDQFNVEAYIIDTSTVAAKTILEVIDPELT
tara:strand:- start:2025 stop:4868 length:2844 start_codon:yes stop_codon:yes gene_type:complete